MTTKTQKLYTMYQAAEEIGVSYSTIRNWKRSGQLKAIPYGQQYRIPESEIYRVRTEGVPRLAS